MLKAYYGKRRWSFPDTDKVIYLTFDDGPIPEVTPWVLDQLQQFDAKATFFCIGDNVRRHPEVFKKVLRAGHRVGNHSQHHLKGWKTPMAEYLKDIALCQQTLNAIEPKEVQGKLFRPPYGQLKSSQARSLMRLGYSIIMWDVLAADFDTQIDGQQCLKNVIDRARPGSIVVFHDSIKAFPRLKVALPAVLKTLSEKGYEFRCIP